MLQKGHGLVLWGRSVREAYMLAFLLNRACEVQIASLAGGVKPYVPPQPVLDITVQQAEIITDGNAPFNAVTWQALAAQARPRRPRLQDLTRPARAQIRILRARRRARADVERETTEKR